MATWIHISSHFKSGYPALQTCTAQSNMVSCRATIATNFVLAEIPSISRNSSRDRRPSTHGRNSFLVTSATNARGIEQLHEYARSLRRKTAAISFVDFLFLGRLVNWWRRNKPTIRVNRHGMSTPRGSTHNNLPIVRHRTLLVNSQIFSPFFLASATTSSYSRVDVKSNTS